MNAYEQWIYDRLGNGDTLASTYGKCREVSEDMHKAFPELRQARGYVWTTWGKRGHYWLVAPDGSIIDPTEDQFPGGVASYEELKVGDEVRVGKCMNCGAEIWLRCKSLTEEPENPHYPACSPECLDELKEAY